MLNKPVIGGGALQLGISFWSFGCPGMVEFGGEIGLGAVDRENGRVDRTVLNKRPGARVSKPRGKPVEPSGHGKERAFAQGGSGAMKQGSVESALQAWQTGGARPNSAMRRMGFSQCGHAILMVQAGRTTRAITGALSRVQTRSKRSLAAGLSQP